MPKPINKDFGQIPCPIAGCQATAAVRRQKNHDKGKPYIVCPVHTRPMHGLDDYIQQYAVWGETSQPDPDDDNDQGTPPAGDNQDRGEKKSGFFSEANKQLNDMGW